MAQFWAHHLCRPHRYVCLRHRTWIGPPDADKPAADLSELPAIVEAALARGWDVTTFNRGSSGKDLPGVRPVHGDRTVIDDVRTLAARGPWDAVIDTSSSDLPPRDVLLATSVLKDCAARWIRLSTVSVYRDWPHSRLADDSELLECPADADENYGYTGEDGSPTIYGQKEGGGRAAELPQVTRQLAWPDKPLQGLPHGSPALRRSSRSAARSVAALGPQDRQGARP